MPSASLTEIMSARAAGIRTGEIARAAGVSPGAISQRLAAVSENSGTAPATASAHDSAYDSLELRALAQLERTLAIVVDPLKLIRIVDSLNHARRRGGALAESSTSTSIQLVLPTIIQNKIVLNSKNEVIEVDGRPLVTATPESLPEPGNIFDCLPGA